MARNSSRLRPDRQLVRLGAEQMPRDADVVAEVEQLEQLVVARGQRIAPQVRLDALHARPRAPGSWPCRSCESRGSGPRSTVSIRGAFELLRCLRPCASTRALIVSAARTGAGTRARRAPRWPQDGRGAVRSVRLPASWRRRRLLLAIAADRVEHAIDERPASVGAEALRQLHGLVDDDGRRRLRFMQKLVDAPGGARGDPARAFARAASASRCLNQRVEPVERAGDALARAVRRTAGPRPQRSLGFLHLPEDGANDGRRELPISP